MRTRTFLIGALPMLLLAIACGGSQETEVRPLIYPKAPPTEQDVVLASLDAALIDQPNENGEVIELVNQRDHLQILLAQEKWYKVVVIRTGSEGWLHHGAIQMRKQSRYWSGDTEDARMTAKSVYEDRRMHGTPVHHIRIEEMSETCIFYVPEQEDLADQTAEVLLTTWYPTLVEMFPSWQEPRLLVYGYQQGKATTFYYSGTEVERFSS